MKYSRWQRFVWQVKRYWILVSVALGVGAFMIYSSPAEDPTGSMIAFMAMKLGQQAVGLGVPTLFFKFVFPKLALQTELVENQNVAIALVYAGAIIGANL